MHASESTGFGASRFWSCRAGLGDIEQFWIGQLEAFKTHAERTRKGERALKTADRVSVTTLVAVDPLTASSISTQEVEIWWKPKVRDLFRKGRTGVMEFDPGPPRCLIEMYFAARLSVRSGPGADLHTWRRLVFEWRQENFAASELSDVEVRFEAVEKSMRVTIEHRGWSTLSLHHSARHGI
jgi:hypothetical protein